MKINVTFLINTFFVLAIVLGWHLNIEILQYVIIIWTGLYGVLAFMLCIAVLRFRGPANLVIFFNKKGFRLDPFKDNKTHAIDLITYDLPCTILLVSVGEPLLAVVYISQMVVFGGLAYVERLYLNMVYIFTEKEKEKEKEKESP
jgi:hypothetical protein